MEQEIAAARPASQLFAVIAATQPNQPLAAYLMEQYGGRVEDLGVFRLSGTNTNVYLCAPGGVGGGRHTQRPE